MPVEELKKVIELTWFTTWMEDGICRTVVKSNAVIELHHAQENTDTVVTLSNNSQPPILVDIRKIKSINKEARDHFAMRDRKPRVCAIAMLINSPLSKVVGNFYLAINQPSVPTKLFNSEDKAIEWLKQFVGNKERL